MDGWFLSEINWFWAEGPYRVCALESMYIFCIHMYTFWSLYHYFRECSEQLKSILPVGQRNGHMVWIGQLFKQLGSDGFPKTFGPALSFFLFIHVFKIQFYTSLIYTKASRENKSSISVPEPTYCCESSPQKCPFDVCVGDALCLLALQAGPGGSRSPSRHPCDIIKQGSKRLRIWGASAPLMVVSRHTCDIHVFLSKLWDIYLPSQSQRNAISERLQFKFSN